MLVTSHLVAVNVDIFRAKLNDTGTHICIWLYHPSHTVLVIHIYVSCSAAVLFNAFTHFNIRKIGTSESKLCENTKCVCIQNHTNTLTLFQSSSVGKDSNISCVSLVLSTVLMLCISVVSAPE